MTVESPSTAMVARPLCPRCGTELPVMPAGTQVIRCEGCGAALQVSVRPMEPGNAPPPVPPVAAGDASARPRRRPMVEVSGPRRAEARPVHTFTVELSQSDIETEGLDKQAPAPRPPPPVAPLAPAAPAAPPPSPDTPWYAEDIERLPEASSSLSQLALENFEALPPLSVRPDVPATSRPASAPARPPGGSSRDK
jgi:hypothetical protein